MPRAASAGLILYALTVSLAGIDWVESNSMRSVLLRHFPALEPALEEVANPFAPWRSVVSPPATPPEDGLAEAARLHGLRVGKSAIPPQARSVA